MQQKVENIFNYLNENTSETEQNKVEKWISESTDNDKVFEEVSKLHSLTGDEFADFNPNVNVAWDNLSDKLFQEEKENVIKTNFGLLMRIAAVLVMSVGLGYFLFNQSSNITYQTITTTAGQIELIELKDGTKIWINEQSNFKYPESFASDKREVYLDGEAYFEVAKNPNKPFIIRSKNTYTQVLGTSFNLKTNLEVSEVNVTSGKVALVHNSDKENKAILEKGEQASLINGLVKKTKQLNENSMAWKTRKLVFESANMGEVVNDLRTFYKVEIVLDENIGNCLITSTFENKSLIEIFEILNVIAQIEYSLNDGIYRLSGPDC